jgi:predicted transcriptional regulator
MYKSYLAYNQLKDYLKALQENGLIEYEVGIRSYKITEKGVRLLELQNRMKELTPINYVET